MSDPSKRYRIEMRLKGHSGKRYCIIDGTLGANADPVAIVEEDCDTAELFCDALNMAHEKKEAERGE